MNTASDHWEDKTDSPEATGDWLKRELDEGLSSPPSDPVTEAFWDRLRSRLRADPSRGDGA